MNGTPQSRQPPNLDAPGVLPVIWGVVFDVKAEDAVATSFLAFGGGAEEAAIAKSLYGSTPKQRVAALFDEIGLGEHKPDVLLERLSEWLVMDRRREDEALLARLDSTILLAGMATEAGGRGDERRAGIEVMIQDSCKPWRAAEMSARLAELSDSHLDQLCRLLPTVERMLSDIQRRLLGAIYRASSDRHGPQVRLSRQRCGGRQRASRGKAAPVRGSRRGTGPPGDDPEPEPSPRTGPLCDDLTRRLPAAGVVAAATMSTPDARQHRRHPEPAIAPYDESTRSELLALPAGGHPPIHRKGAGR